MKPNEIIRSIGGLILLLPLLILIVLTVLSFFGVDDGGYVTRFSSWLIAGLLASGASKVIPDFDSDKDKEE